MVDTLLFTLSVPLDYSTYLLYVGTGTYTGLGTSAGRVVQPFLGQKRYDSIPPAIIDSSFKHEFELDAS